MINLVWLKRDLRVSDHRPLYEASRNGLPTLVLYVIEPPYWQLADSSARQFQFIASSLLCLAKQLQALSGTLTVRQGDVVEVFNKIHQHIAVAHVFAIKKPAIPGPMSAIKKCFNGVVSRMLLIMSIANKRCFAARLTATNGNNSPIGGCLASLTLAHG